MTIHAEEIPLRTALTLTLRPLGLDWYIRHECLIVTSNEDLAASPVLRAYGVSRLFGDKPLGPEAWRDWIAPLTDRREVIRPKTEFRNGESVLARRQDQFVPATVVQQSGTSLQVRYTDSAQMDWVEASDARVVVSDGSPPPLVDYYAPTGSLVVYGPETLHRRIESLLAVLERARPRPTSPLDLDF